MASYSMWLGGRNWDCHRELLHVGFTNRHRHSVSNPKQRVVSGLRNSPVHLERLSPSFAVRNFGRHRVSVRVIWTKGRGCEVRGGG